MRLNSKVVALIVLVIMFGGILLTTDLGWWQTEGGGRGAGNHDGASETPPEVTVLRGTIITDDGQSLAKRIELGNSRYNRSIGFAPQVGERVTVEAFIPGGKTSYRGEHWLPTKDVDQAIRPVNKPVTASMPEVCPTCMADSAVVRMRSEFSP